MLEIVKRIEEEIREGRGVAREEALKLLKSKAHEELIELAHRLTAEYASKKFDFCAIINARSGCCGEDCKWCAQSAHWGGANSKVYGFIGKCACAREAKAAEANKVRRIAIVTAGRGQSKSELDEICEAIREMKANTSIGICASLGIVDLEDLKKLKAAGLERLHCNIETAPSRFGKLCSTHTIEEKIATIENAKSIGLEVCSGGIIGMGESDEELVEFAFKLREISPTSIPVNILDPIPGTPLGDLSFLDLERILDSIAILRIVNPAISLRFAGGRRRLDDAAAARCIYAGINSGIQGPLLTTRGSDWDDDRELAKRAGYEI